MEKETVYLTDENAERGSRRLINKRFLVGGAVAIAVGFLLFVLGFIIMYVAVDAVVENQVYKNLDIVKGSDTYDAWVEPPIAVHLTFNFFHILNPDDVIDGTEIPQVQEIGPYAFLEYWRKENVFELDMEYYTYDQYNEYEYDPEETAVRGCINTKGEACKKDDPMTVINPILVAIAAIIPRNATGFFGNLIQYGTEWEDVLQGDLDKFWEDFDDAVSGRARNCDNCEDTVILQTTPIDLLFDKFTSNSMNALKYALDRQNALPCAPNVPGDCSIIKAALIALGYDVDNLPSDIGFFAGANASSAEANYVVNNGRFRHDQLINIEKWNGAEKLPDHWWPKVGPTPGATRGGAEGVCHDIHGTDGTQFPAYLDKDQRLWVFISDMCRSLWLEYYGDAKVFSIDVLDYRPPADVYNMQYELNYCYCPMFDRCAKESNDSDSWDITECDRYCKEGMIRLDNCFAGAPVIMTAPHFLHGDQRLIDAIKGLNPNVEEHETIMLVDPLIGVTLSAHKRIMISMGTETKDYITPLKTVNETVFPLLWLDEYAEMTEEDEKDYINAITKPINIADGVVIGIFMVGGSLLFLSGIVLCWFS